MKAFSRAHAGLAVASSAALSLGLAACASDLGQEWQAITAEQSSIALTAPGLEDQRVRFLRGRTEGWRSTVELAVWSGPDSRHPKAAVTHVKASAGFLFRTRRGPRRHVEGATDFADLDLSFGDLERDINGQGPIEFQRFSGPGLDCLAFVQYWGSSSSDGVVGGTTRMLYGHYCATPGETLSDDTATEVVKGLVIRR